MSTALISYFHFQPKAGPFSYFDISNKAYYSSEEKNIGLKNLLNSELEVMLSFLEKNAERKINLVLSIPVLELLVEQPKGQSRIKKMIKKGQLELLACPGYDSLSVLFSRALFKKEIALQMELMESLFSYKPTGFINTALLYSDKLAEIIEESGFAYTIVPGISWYLKDSTAPHYRSGSGKLKLFVPVNSFAELSAKPNQVILASSFEGKTVGEISEFSLLSEFKNDPKPNEYALPNLAAYDLELGGLGMIVGNNLQKDYLARLKELSSRVESTNDSDLIADYLWLGSLAHFKALSNSAADRHKVYSKLLTMLYDLEIRLR
jgi:hypothetical protein